jgi:glycosyltransferase involved in cell wall biosynthesis
MYKMKKEIYYWSPYFSKIATEKAVLNSIESLKKYSNQKYEPILINAIGEWDWLKKKKISFKVHNLTNYKIINFLPKEGFFFSRISNLIIFLLCFFPLLKFLKKKDCYVIIHLLTSLPLFLCNFFKINSKIFLRISGLPKLNYFRKYMWKFSNNKLQKIICPTLGTLEYLKKNKIFKEEKMVFVRDPVFAIKDLNYKNKENLINQTDYKNFYLSIGRLTKQKNFEFLINCFSKLIKKDPELLLIILGEGEKRKILEKKIKNYNLENNVKLLGYEKNVYSYLNHCKFFILPSLWEDPGFVLIEAAVSNTSIISSDCENGPKDFLNNNTRGYSFKNNDENSFIETFLKANEDSKANIFKKKVKAKKEAKLYSMYNHYKELIKIFL